MSSSILLSSKQTWIMLAVFVLLAVFTIYNVINATNERSMILKITQNITKSNNNILNQIIANQIIDARILKNANNVSQANHQILNELKIILQDVQEKVSDQAENSTAATTTTKTSK